jgi:hypothetical protein
MLDSRRLLKNLAGRYAWLAAGLVGLSALSVAGRGGPTSPVRAQVDTVHYAAGWNLVAVPTATLLEKATGPQYAFGPGGDGYEAVGPGEVIGGRAVWAYFPQDTDITVGHSAAEFSRVVAPADHWVLIGNPSTSEKLPLNGTDEALAYDVVAGYHDVSELQPGQGAWVMSHVGGDISLGKAPSGPQADEIRRLQTLMTDAPTDRGNFDVLGAVAAELVNERQYSQVQSAMDDLRAAEQDGLRKQGSGAFPSLSSLQRDSAVGVREDLALARDALQAGDFDHADRAIEAAKRSAQAAQDDGVAIARGQGSAHSAVFTSVRQQSPDALAAFGALVRSAFFSTSLGAPPADPFWNVATAVLTGRPLPPPAGGGTSSSPDSGTCPASACTFSGDGTADLALTSGRNDIAWNAKFTFQFSISGGTVSGQGQQSTVLTFMIPQDLPGGCNFPPSSGPITVSGTLTGTTLRLSFRSAGGGVTTVSCFGQSIPTADFLATDAVFDPVNVEARDGATGTGQLLPRFTQVFTGSMKVTIHAAQSGR